jgi:hypothetical protein
MSIPLWLLVFLPGVSAACAAILPWLIGLVLLGIGSAVLSEGCVWGLHLLTRAATALPNCWLCDGPARTSDVCQVTPPRPAKVAALDWDYRNDTTDYPSGRR